MNFLIPDLIFLFNWWFVILIIGFLFLPITATLFNHGYDCGYLFAKILGITFFSYCVFLFGSLRIVSFNKVNSILVLALFAVLGLFVAKKISKNINFISLIKNHWQIFLLEEVIFLVMLSFWSLVKSYQPSIYGLEKYMDFGFVNSILRSDYFPPRDMWFTPFSINYYYFGHLMTAVLIKISSLPPAVSYNLMLATLFAFAFSASFSLGLNLSLKFFSKIRPAVLTGVLAGILVTLAGNLHTLYLFFKPYDVEKPLPFWELVFSPLTFPNNYWYPNATRFIYNTIHEFPIYSFVVSDLHGHVLDIPIVLTILAFLLNEFLSQKIRPSRYLVVAFLLAVAYMTNVWDGLIYFLLTICVLFVLNLIDLKERARTKPNPSWYSFFFTALLILAGFLFFSFPFSYFFKPFASGIGVLCAPEFLTDIGKIGPFLFEKDHCQRSPWWQLLILYGFFYFWVILFLSSFIKIKNQSLKLKNAIQGSKLFLSLPFLKKLELNLENLRQSDLFVLILIFLSTFLVIIPEFIYIKDIYPAHYRANTMFKLVYQTFIILSLSSAYIVIRIIGKWKIPSLRAPAEEENGKFFYWKFVYLLIGIIGLFLVSIYPYFAVNSYFDNFKKYQGLDGLTYLKDLYPTDYEAINWLNINIKGQPVILEAQGDSYTDYARVSANTGLPTVLGWTVHEWLWRGTYDVAAPRINDIQNLYESNDLNLTKALIEKYEIEYVFVGTLERQKYQKLNEEKFNQLGIVLYQNSGTKIYKINN